MHSIKNTLGLMDIAIGYNFIPPVPLHRNSDQAPSIPSRTFVEEITTSDATQAFR
jgi:hypothetical protein